VGGRIRIPGLPVVTVQADMYHTLELHQLVASLLHFPSVREAVRGLQVQTVVQVLIRLFLIPHLLLLSA